MSAPAFEAVTAILLIPLGAAALLGLLKDYRLTARLNVVASLLTLASGVVFSEEVFGRAARLNHKTISGIVSWLVFGALLFGRHFHGWRGRVAVRWTLAGFLMLVLAYLGSKFVVEVLLGRS